MSHYWNQSAFGVSFLIVSGDQNSLSGDEKVEWWLRPTTTNHCGQNPESKIFAKRIQCGTLSTAKCGEGELKSSKFIITTIIPSPRLHLHVHVHVAFQHKHVHVHIHVCLEELGMRLEITYYWVKFITNFSKRPSFYTFAIKMRSSAWWLMMH